MATACQERPRTVARWPLAEGLALWREQQRAHALRSFRHSELVWALLAPHQKKAAKPPALPPILKTEG